MGERKKITNEIREKTLSQMKMNTINQNLTDAEKTVPRGKSIAINTYIKNKNLS